MQTAAWTASGSVAPSIENGFELVESMASDG